MSHTKYESFLVLPEVQRGTWERAHATTWQMFKESEGQGQSQEENAAGLKGTGWLANPGGLEVGTRARLCLQIFSKTKRGTISPLVFASTYQYIL